MLASGAAAAAFTIVRDRSSEDRDLLHKREGTLAHIGCGTQGLREMPVCSPCPDPNRRRCDPVKESHDYVDWPKMDCERDLAAHWANQSGGGPTGISGGRESRRGHESFYAKERRSEKFNGCSRYRIFRELLEKEKDVTAVKIHDTRSSPRDRRDCGMKRASMC